MRSRDNFYLKTIKYHAYKKYVGKPRWNNDYLFERAVRRLKKGDIAIDCGAHIGRYTGMLAATGAAVYAFEPDPRNFEQLQENVGHYPNVTLYNAALDVQDGPGRLYVSNKFLQEKSNREGSTIVLEKEFIDGENYFEISRSDFISFLKGFRQRISLIKMDIEGAELDILNAMLKEGMFSIVDNMFVETHEKQIPLKEQEFKTLRKAIELAAGNNVHLDWH